MIRKKGWERHMTVAQRKLIRAQALLREADTLMGAALVVAPANQINHTHNARYVAAQASDKVRDTLHCLDDMHLGA